MDAVSVSSGETGDGGEASSRGRGLRFDSLLMIVAKGSGGALNLVLLVLIARRLGPSVQGVVSVGLALALILLQLTSLGLVTANPAWVARSIGTTSQLIVNSAWWAAGLGLLAAAIALGTWLLVPSTIQGLTGDDVLLVAVSLPFALASLLLEAVLLGELQC